MSGGYDSRFSRAAEMNRAARRCCGLLRKERVFVVLFFFIVAVAVEEVVIIVCVRGWLRFVFRFEQLKK